MPFLTENELLDYRTQIEEAKQQERVINYTHHKQIEDRKEETQKYKIAAILLGILAIIGIASTIYYQFFNMDHTMIPKEQYFAEIANYQNKITELESTIQELSIKKELAQNTTSSEQPSLNNELVYTVQIGAYRNENMDLSLYSEKFVNFKEIRGEPFNKYAIGNFATLKEAQQFRKQIVKLGLKNAFIASYQDGKRIKIEKTR
ncbi:SPOR domain-containing protein [Aquimarina sp. ERC-38]|uniref:SPOR domain-containing protein n=1 Tax=Aquimarina sp. ERC-38 TaxID=2949996 RepID=UPI00224547B5|nr:SPOR domain-containing protein [Aquimarina sp. ERC-38]UZO81139.1 SPOR domain-containing protein [Aquimarina sp. ERC-38]